MYYSQLLMLDDILNKDQIIKLQNFMSTLTPNTSKLITVSKLKSAIDISEYLAANVLGRCVEVGIMRLSYGIRCPECGTVLRKIEEPHFDKSINCYKCEDFTFMPTDEDIVVFFELLNEIPPFSKGQQEKIINDINNVQVAPCDSLASFNKLCSTAIDYMNRRTEQDIQKSEKNKRLKKNEYKIQSIENSILESSEHRRNTNRRIILILQILLFIAYAFVIHKIFIMVDDSKLSCSLSVASSIFVFVADKLVNSFICTDINVIKSIESKKYRNVLEGLNEEKKVIELG